MLFRFCAASTLLIADVMTTHRRILALLLGVAPLSAALLIPTAASAQQRYYRVDNLEAARYPVEVDIHGSLGADNVYGNLGEGAGVRVSIPLVAGWLGRGVSDNLAISFGGELLNYQNCYFDGRCGANYLMVPVAAQWNIFFGRRVSLFGEGGVFLYKGFFDGCGPGVDCAAPSDFGVLPTFALGLRVRLSPYVALVGRLGYPVSTLGISFL
jgi:hypothetical protein